MSLLNSQASPIEFRPATRTSLDWRTDCLQRREQGQTRGVDRSRVAKRRLGNCHEALEPFRLFGKKLPDIAVVLGSFEDYAAQHPATAVLVIEVSESTIEEDTHAKASLYASGGIADYWVIDLTRDQVLVFRSPKPEAGAKFGQTYASVSAHGRDDKLTPLAAPNARVLVGDLLP